ncbi:MAG: AAA family ATPase [Desulfuromonadales bacterium]
MDQEQSDNREKFFAGVRQTDASVEAIALDLVEWIENRKRWIVKYSDSLRGYISVCSSHGTGIFYLASNAGKFHDKPYLELKHFSQKERLESILFEKLVHNLPTYANFNKKMHNPKRKTSAPWIELEWLKEVNAMDAVKESIDAFYTEEFIGDESNLKIMPTADPPKPEKNDSDRDSTMELSDNNDLDKIRSFLTERNFRIDPQLLRRYHISLKTRKFVVLSGISGTGKTWLAELYAAAVGARVAVVPVAPNWTSNEDLLGYFNPLDKSYHDTDFSLFLREAARDFTENGDLATPYHLVLDEMNLARVEYYFAKFLSLMEVRSRAKNDDTFIELGNDKVLFPPNLYFIGTVNIDETTHVFADKVYDRAQLIEMGITRESVVNHLGDAVHSQALLKIWDTVHETAPFAFRVIDEIGAYIDESSALGVPWPVALDEQIVQKILPKVKGTSIRIDEILEYLISEFPEFKLTQAKSRVMLEGFRNHGFASYF